MEAHALQARMEEKSIAYPFLCLLISGGHCQLTFVQSPKKFLLLGDTLDDAPGEMFDKVARNVSWKCKVDKVLTHVSKLTQNLLMTMKMMMVMRMKWKLIKTTNVNGKWTS
ncbi:hypothetical protein PSTG_19450 [Puccinia striiformis f. sp. tritici PST-78]|uniref:N(6)-L-threonylcarbamoyladenine synthase n=1 Tax=Puccinia striiformis f. sp. tritici PST-78 TaxID=1165861 RepID=A0A0L0UJI2_9BASI|nr:hypothetical protein PSTG_19450 [Puccinia striiformis f. sp. tritici PST-78]